MEAIIMAAQLILGLSILVGLHEFGHLLAAKIFGMRVEKYSIGFPPKIWGFKYGETEYSLGAVPLGGFVKISGMIDESLDTKSLNDEPQPYEFRAKPAWQRLIVMMGGIVVNVITGIVIFILIVYNQGESYIPKDEVVEHGIVAYELGEEVGFKTGDKVIKINGEDYDRFMDLRSADMLLSDNGYYIVNRNGESIKLFMPEGFLDKFSDRESQSKFIEPRMPFKVGPILEESNAEKGNLEEGDEIVSINDKPVKYFDQLKSILSENKGTSINMVVNRDSQEKRLTLDVTEEGTLGFYPVSLLEVSKESYSLAEASVVGTTKAFNIVWVNIRAFGKMISGKVDARKSLAGPIGIAQIFGGTWNWINFWNITGLLSMVLAFMNFLPIPALDGGHVMFLTYEILSGNKPSDRFLENAQKVGMVLLISLMGFVIFNDIYKVFT
ncbi:MAG TPA: RIP metalloprotease RseP [Cyclobacteriaceae bacterium]